MKKVGALQTLIRLDLANARAFLRGAGRDPVFMLAVVLAFAAGVMGFRRLLAVEVDPGLRQIIVTLGFAYLVASFYAWNSQGHLQRLTAGPFQPLVVRPRAQAVWLTFRSVTFTLVFVILAVIAALSLDPATTPSFVGQALLGLVFGAVAVATIGSVLSLAGGARQAGRVAEGAEGVKYTSLEPASLMLTWAHLRRRIGPAPIFVLAAVLLATAGAGGALANQNNGPTAGAGVVLAFSVAAAWLLVDIDLNVVRQLGHEPIGLVRLCSMFVGPALVVMIGALAAAFAAGLGLKFALVIATLMVMAVLVYVLLLILNGLVLSPPAARMAASVDVALAVGLPLMAGVWGEFWIIGRIFMLILAAGRLRWRDL